jgi:methionyl-tRNA formyltransferase
VRILCCLNRDLASSMALNLLLPLFAKHEVQVGLSEQVGKACVSADEHPARRELRLAEQTFPNEVFFPLIERAALPDAANRYLTFAEVARYRGIRIASLRDPNSPEGMKEIREFDPDLIISIRYGAIFRSAVISIPRSGVLNLHSGILPHYRGVLATFRALLAGDAQIGCTLHYITDGTIDTGPIVSMARAPVCSDRSLLWHILSLYPLGVGLIADALQKLSLGTPPSIMGASAGRGAYYSHPENIDWENFRRVGWRSVEAGDLDGALRLYFRNPGRPHPAES